MLTRVVRVRHTHLFYKDLRAQQTHISMNRPVSNLPGHINVKYCSEEHEKTLYRLDQSVVRCLIRQGKCWGQRAQRDLLSAKVRLLEWRVIHCFRVQPKKTPWGWFEHEITQTFIHITATWFLLCCLNN